MIETTQVERIMTLTINYQMAPFEKIDGFGVTVGH
jgi:3-hydroxyacyl-CoA dehydrogenase